MHTIAINHPVAWPEDGLLLGNGDLSLSVYQKSDAVVFRFGKGDLWDTRLDPAENPPPLDINELKEAIETYHLSCDSFGNGLTTDSPARERFRALCGNRALSHAAPNPKPGAELTLHYSGDLKNLRISQLLVLETGRIEIRCHWDNDVRLALELVVHPEKNRLALRWRLDNWHDGKRFGGNFYGLPEPHAVFFSLSRANEVPITEFRLRETYCDSLVNCYDATLPLLPQAEIVTAGGIPVLLQRLPDRQCAFAVGGRGLQCRTVANILFGYPESLNADAGEISVGVSTASPEDAAELVKTTDCADDFRAAERAAQQFWSASGISLESPELEKLWYATLHAKHCVMKKGKMPPGLMLPSTIQDYSSWHGDYHLNYNYQSNFLGDFEANHCDTGDAFFTGLEPLMKLGRKIARDYYHCRGCFIQLSGFPFDTADDYLGTLPLGRMAYMTGWVAAWFHRRWRCTMDREWLQATGYPALREFALFYTDFLTRGDDGCYHAFPSNQGEEDYSLAGTRDKPQVLRHARHALRCAVEAARELGIDGDLAIQWTEILDHLAPGSELPDRLAAEFSGFDGKAPRPAGEFLTPGSSHYDWYPGQVPYLLMTALYCRCWEPERDFALLTTFLKRWMHDNGLLWAMAVTNYGHEGIWTEGLGILGGINALLLQNRDGRLAFFPGWPRNRDAAFESLRAERAFLCSARLESGEIRAVRIVAEAGGCCQIENPWPGKNVVVRRAGRSETVASSAVLEVNTTTSEVFELSPES